MRQTSQQLALLPALAVAALLTACGGGGGSGGGSSGGGGQPSGPTAPALGTGDHSPTSVTFTVISGAGLTINNPMDMAFSPIAPNELWIINQGAAATSDDSLIIFNDVTAATITGERIDNTNDGNWGHFYMNASGIAFGAQTSSAGNGWTFATSQDATRAGDNFMGPTLWSADRTIIGHYGPGAPPMSLGSHLDMLHSTRYAKGIAHQQDNIFWVVGQAYYTVLAGSPQVCLTRYNYNADHGPGYDNHSDGVKTHYAAGAVSTVTGIPSGMYFRPANNRLYVADTGNGRIVALNTTTGNTPASVNGHTGDGQDFAVTGATVEVIVPPSTVLTNPSGLEHHNGLLYVADHATGIIHAFDLNGNRVNWLDTGLGASALTGLAFDANGKLYFCDIKNDRIVRIDP